MVRRHMRGLENWPMSPYWPLHVRRHMRGLEKDGALECPSETVRRHMRGLESYGSCAALGERPLTGNEFV